MCTKTYKCEAKQKFEIKPSIKLFIFFKKGSADIGIALIMRKLYKDIIKNMPHTRASKHVKTIN